MSKHSIVGSGSLMPESTYLKKIEQTCLYEDPDQLDAHFRFTLKDRRPSEILFESDQPRYNNYSRDRLNLRHHGRRTTAEPYLPDGSFIDWQFLDKDPRGTAMEPDFSKHRSQQEYRGKYIKHGNDEDNSVPSSGWHPTHVIRDINAQFYNMKSRMKIFDESMDGRHNGGVYVNKLHTSTQCLVENDEKKPIMRDEMCYNRANIINDLSNDTAVGYKRVTDHRFQIAKYGQIRSVAPLETQNWNKNRMNAKIDHDIMLSWKDQQVPQTIVIKMADMANRKRQEIDSGKTTYLHESQDNQFERSRKLTPQDLIQIKLFGDESRGEDAHTAINGIARNLKQGRPQLDKNRGVKVIIDPSIVDFMSSVNRKMQKHEFNDLREDVEQSGEISNLLIEGTNISANKDYDTGMLWESKHTDFKDDSQKIANYAKLAYKLESNMQTVDFEQFTKRSKESNQRTFTQTNDLYGAEVVDYDNTFGKDIESAKLIGHMGNKYMRRLMDYDGKVNNLNVEAVNSR